jgi:hypothetical protein
MLFLTRAVVYAILIFLSILCLFSFYLLIVNAKVVDVFTGTVRESPVSVGRGRFLGFSHIPARETLDAGGAYLLPGRISASAPGKLPDKFEKRLE